MTTEARLRELYAANPVDHRAIALAERDAWEEYCRSFDGKKQRREDWFHERFGVTPPTWSMYRQGILGHDEWARPLWVVANEVGLGRAYRICIKLRSEPNRAEEAKRFSENLDEARRLKVRPSKRATKSVSHSPEESKELRARINEIVRPFVEQKVADLNEPGVTEDIVSAFEIDVATAFEDLLRRIRRTRSTSGAKSIIGDKRRSLRRACEFLGLRLPTKGGSLDMDEARRAYRKLSAQFHPDRTNNNELMTDQYLEVQKAWEIISEYQP